MTKHRLASGTVAAAFAAALGMFASSGVAQTAPPTDAGTKGKTDMGSAGYGSNAAQSESGSGATGAQSGSSGTTGSAQAGGGQAGDTMQQVNNSVKVVKKMESDPQVRKLLQQAKGVFIVPQYGRGGLGIAGQGGEGVLLVNNNGKWSSPAFYNLGGVSIGAQAGAEIGSLAMILMNEKAVNSFMQENNFSVNADAGLTIANYTAKAGTSAGKGDVIVWYDTKGAFADAAVGVTDIHFDDDENRAFYKSQQVSPKDIVAGKFKSTQAAALTKALPSGGASGAAASGSSGTGGSGSSGNADSAGKPDSAGGAAGK